MYIDMTLIYYDATYRGLYLMRFLIGGGAACPSVCTDILVAFAEIWSDIWLIIYISTEERYVNDTYSCSLHQSWMQLWWKFYWNAIITFLALWGCPMSFIYFNICRNLHFLVVFCCFLAMSMKIYSATSLWHLKYLKLIHVDRSAKC